MHLLYELILGHDYVEIICYALHDSCYEWNVVLQLSIEQSHQVLDTVWEFQEFGVLVHVVKEER